MSAADAVLERLMHAPYGHRITRDAAGNAHVTLYDERGQVIHTIVAPTFEEAATRALDIADRMRGVAA